MWASPKAPRLEKEEPAMAVRSQEMHTTARAGSPPSRTRIMFPAISLHSVAYIVTALLALLAIYAIMGNVMGWGRARYDDLRYGTTRTFQADEVLGYDDINRDGSKDLIVNVKNEEIVYLNKDAQFQPITAEERVKLTQSH